MRYFTNPNETTVIDISTAAIEKLDALGPASTVP
jgi:hypothetical protein